MGTILGNSLFVKCAIEHELAMAELYSLFKEKVSRDAEFWEQLAIDEREQAKLLEKLQDGIADGMVSLRDPRMPVKSIVESTTKIRSNVSTMENWGVKRQEAYEFALEMEESPVEQEIYTAFESHNDYLTAAIEMTVESNKDHLQELTRHAKGGPVAWFGRFMFWK